MPRRRMSSIAPLAASAATVPPWPSGLRNSSPFSASNNLPVSASTAGIVPWQNSMSSSSRQAKAVMLLKKLNLFVMRDGTRHHVDGHRRPVPTCERLHLFKMNLQKGRAGDWPNRKHSLGVVEAEPTPLPSRNQKHGNAASSKGLTTAILCVRSVKVAAALSILQSNGWWRTSTSGEGGPILGVSGLANQRRHLLEVNRLNLLHEPLPTCIIQLVPEAQQMLLPERL